MGGDQWKILACPGYANVYYCMIIGIENNHLNNCLFSYMLIGSFLSPIRVQIDKMLNYAAMLSSSTFSCQTVNFLTNEVSVTFLLKVGIQKSQKSYSQCSHHFEWNSLIFDYGKFTAFSPLIYSWHSTNSGLESQLSLFMPLSYHWQ